MTTHEYTFYSMREAASYLDEQQRHPGFQRAEWTADPYLVKYNHGYLDLMPECCKITVKVWMVER